MKEWNVKEVAMLTKMLVSSERLFKKHSEHIAENSATFLVKIPNLFFFSYVIIVDTIKRETKFSI